MSEIFETEPEYGNSAGRVNMTGYTGSKWREVRLDSSTRAINTIDYEHHEIHGGSHFIVATNTNTAASGKFEAAITTPATTKEIHIILEATNEAETTLTFNEDATFSNTGITITPVNSNRCSTTTSGALAVTCSMTGAGTTILAAHVGSGKVGGGVRTAQELILKTGTNYVSSILNNTAQTRWHSVQWTWYEHTPKAA